MTHVLKKGEIMLSESQVGGSSKDWGHHRKYSETLIIHRGSLPGISVDMKNHGR